MNIFLKWFYGYKNFGDELLLLGVLNYLQEHYTIENIVIEAEDKIWLEHRIRKNKMFLGDVYKKIHYQALITSKVGKALDILKRVFWKDKYKSYHKFFWGGEVLNPERSWLHSWRNLYWYYIFGNKNPQYSLIGGVWKITHPKHKKLYKKILPKAQKIILREKDSYKIVCDFLKDELGLPTDNVELYQDFSLSILEQSLNIFQQQEQPNSQASQTKRYQKIKSDVTQWAEKVVNFLKTWVLETQKPIQSQEEYILINITANRTDDETVNKISKFAEEYATTRKFFFPCDIKDDLPLYEALKEKIPDLEIFNRTEYSLIETLHLLYHAKAGIGARLHFLYPLKVFNRPLEAIVYKDKVRKLILS